LVVNTAGRIKIRSEPNLNCVSPYRRGLSVKISIPRDIRRRSLEHRFSKSVKNLQFEESKILVRVYPVKIIFTITIRRERVRHINVRTILVKKVYVV